MKHNQVILRDLTTGYGAGGKKTIVITAGINATLPTGQLTALLGPNGAGKSTLIKTISGNLNPISGTLEIDGRNITDYSPAELSRELSVVLTERFLSTHLTVTDLVGLGRSPYTGLFGRLTHDDKEIVGKAIELVGISHLASRTVSTLSDGERQKAMIARALAQDTPVIFLDEPTAFLDYPGKVDIMMLLRRLCHHEGKSVLISTHDLDLALLLSDRLWLLDRKHGLLTGMTEDLILNNRIEQYFTGDRLRFDAATASFIVEFPVYASVTVKGDGTRMILAKRALRRAGISPERVSENPDVVIDNEAWYFEGKPHASIESLVDAVSESRLH